MLLLLNKGCSIKKRRIWLVSPKIQLRLRLKHLVVIVTTDHKNIHFDLFLIPKHHSITNKLYYYRNSPFFWTPFKKYEHGGEADIVDVQFIFCICCCNNICCCRLSTAVVGVNFMQWCCVVEYKCMSNRVLWQFTTCQNLFHNERGVKCIDCV